MPQGGPLSPLLANITLDPLDPPSRIRFGAARRVPTCRGVARRAKTDDFLVMVGSARAAQRVMASLTRFVEGRLKLVVNRVKSQAAPLKHCAFLGFQIGSNGNSRGRADAICSHSEFRGRRFTWPRAAARGTGG